MKFEEYSANLGLELEEFMDLVKLFITTARADIEKYRAACLKGDGQEAARAAHSIKGAAGNLGFAEFSAFAKDAELSARNEDLQNFETHIRDFEAKLVEIESHIP